VPSSHWPTGFSRPCAEAHQVQTAYPLQPYHGNLAAEIIEDLQSALEELQAISDDLALTPEGRDGIDETKQEAHGEP